MNEIITSGTERAVGENLVASVWALISTEDQGSLHRLARLGPDVFLPAARKMLKERIREDEEELRQLRDALARVEREATSSEGGTIGSSASGAQPSPGLVQLAEQVLGVVREVDPEHQGNCAMLRQLSSLSPRTLFLQAAARVLPPLVAPEEKKLAEIRGALCAVEADTGVAPMDQLAELVFCALPFEERTRDETTMLARLRWLDRGMFIQASVPLLRRAVSSHEQRLERLRTAIDTLGAARVEAT